MYVIETLNNWSISCSKNLTKQQKEVSEINANLLHIPCSQMSQKLFRESHKWPEQRKQMKLEALSNKQRGKD